MNKGSKRLISRMLAFVMLFTSIFSNTLIVSAEESTNNPSKIWDFTGTATGSAIVADNNGKNAFSREALDLEVSPSGVLLVTTGGSYHLEGNKTYVGLNVKQGNVFIATGASVNVSPSAVAGLTNGTKVEFDVNGSTDIEISGYTTDSAYKLKISGEKAYLDSGKTQIMDFKNTPASGSSVNVYKYRGTAGKILIEVENDNSNNNRTVEEKDIKILLESIKLTELPKDENPNFEIGGIKVSTDFQNKVNVENKTQNSDLILSTGSVTLNSATFFAKRGVSINNVDEITSESAFSGNAYNVKFEENTNARTKTFKVTYGTEGNTYDIIIKEQATFSFPGYGSGAKYYLNVSAGAVEFVSPSSVLLSNNGIEYGKPNYVKLNFDFEKLQNASETFSSIVKTIAGINSLKPEGITVSNIKWNNESASIATGASFVITTTTGSAFEVEAALIDSRPSINDLDNVNLSTGFISLEIDRGVITSATGDAVEETKTGNVVVLKRDFIIAQQIDAFKTKYGDTAEYKVTEVNEPDGTVIGMEITKPNHKDSIIVKFENGKKTSIKDLPNVNLSTDSIDITISHGAVTTASGAVVEGIKENNPNVIVLKEGTNIADQVKLFEDKYNGIDEEYKVTKTEADGKADGIKIENDNYTDSIIVKFENKEKEPEQPSINDLDNVNLSTSSIEIKISKGLVTDASGEVVEGIKENSTNVIVLKENTDIAKQVKLFEEAYDGTGADKYKVTKTETGGKADGIEITKANHTDSIIVKFETKKSEETPSINTLEDVKLSTELIELKISKGVVTTASGAVVEDLKSNNVVVLKYGIIISDQVAAFKAKYGDTAEYKVTEILTNNIATGMKIEKQGYKDSITVKFENGVQPITDPSVKVNVGEIDSEGYVTAEFVIENNPGINNYTFFVNYNPKIIEAVSAEAGTVKYDAGNDKISLMQKGMMDEAIITVPKVDNPDYAGLNPDGKLTEAKLGRLKFSGVAGLDQHQRVETKENGTLFTIKFKVLGYGTTNISIDPVGEKAYAFYGLGEIGTNPRDIELYPGEFKYEQEAVPGMNFELKFIDMGITVVSSNGSLEFNGDAIVDKKLNTEINETIVVVNKDTKISIENRVLEPEDAVEVVPTEGKVNSVTITYTGENGEKDVRIITFENEQSEPDQKPSKDKFTISAGDYTISVADGKVTVEGIDSKYDAKPAFDADGNIVVSLKDEEGVQDLINSIIDAFKAAGTDDIKVAEYTDPETGAKGLKLTIAGEEIIVKFTVETEEPPVPQDFKTTLTINGETIELEVVDGVLTAIAQPGYGKSVTKDDGTLMVPYVGKDRKTNLRGLTSDLITVAEGYKVVSFEQIPQPDNTTKFLLKIAREDGTDEQEMLIFTYGDYNFDGVLNLSDSLAVMNYLAMPKSQQNEVPEYKKLCVDVNTDGILNLSDSLSIMNYLMGIPLPLK